MKITEAWMLKYNSYVRLTERAIKEGILVRKKKGSNAGVFLGMTSNGLRMKIRRNGYMGVERHEPENWEPFRSKLPKMMKTEEAASLLEKKGFELVRPKTYSHPEKKVAARIRSTKDGAWIEYGPSTAGPFIYSSEEGVRRIPNMPPYPYS